MTAVQFKLCLFIGCPQMHVMEPQCSTSVTFLFVVKLHHIPASHTCIIYISYIFIFCTIYIFSKEKNSKTLPLPLLDLKSIERPCMIPLRLSAVF